MCMPRSAYVVIYKNQKRTRASAEIGKKTM